ncbi:MAG: patatin-like phospholipase family protein [Hyphomicrobium sp.]
MPRSVAEHLDPAFAPKRILSLDGGGTKGIIEIAFLEKIESLLAGRTSNPAAFRLCDYFDLIGGTSTGSIIATALALGMTAAEVKDLYFRLARKIFRKPWFGIPGFAPRFHARGLGKVLLEVLGERPLESEDLKTGLAIIAKRLDTGSPWVLTNNPRSKFWNDPDRDAATGKVLHIGNRHYRVREVLRASTAAPYYFSPKKIRIVETEPEGLFVDGSVSPYNNPSLQLFMLAGIKGYGFNWAIDKDKLLLVSIGAGGRQPKLDPVKGLKMAPVSLAIHALQGMSWDTQVQALQLLQWVSETPRPWHINSEVGTLEGELLGDRPLLRFHRYDVKLDPQWIAQRTDLTVSEAEIVRLDDFVNPGIMQEIYEIAAKVAASEVRSDDFPASFNIF